MMFYQAQHESNIDNLNPTMHHMLLSTFTFGNLDVNTFYLSISTLWYASFI